jgi:hypothetical protein
LTSADGGQPSAQGPSESAAAEAMRSGLPWVRLRTQQPNDGAAGVVRQVDFVGSSIPNDEMK